MNAWKEYKKRLGDTRPWDVLNPNTPKANDETSNYRMSLCKKCPELINATKQCKQCGCIMTAKVKLETATCPLGKW